VFAHDAANYFDVTLDVKLDLVVGQLDHRYDVIELLVLVLDENRERFTDLRLMKDAFAGVGSIALELCLDFAGKPVFIGFCDCFVATGMILLADEMYSLTAFCERGDDGSCPEIAARSLEKPAMKQADHSWTVSTPLSTYL
jgi:hypothetical protein